MYANWKGKYVLSADKDYDKAYSTQALGNGYKEMLQYAGVQDLTSKVTHFNRYTHLIEQQVHLLKSNGCTLTLVGWLALSHWSHWLLG